MIDKNDERFQISKDEFELLEKELKQFKDEKERVRGIIGRIGGVPTFTSKLINIGFFVVVIGSLLGSFFVHSDMWRYILLDLGVAVLSIKVLYVIHTLTKENHFELWILTSLEWQLNEVRNEMRKIMEKIDKLKQK